MMMGLVVLGFTNLAAVLLVFFAIDGLRRSNRRTREAMRDAIEALHRRAR